MIYVTGLPRSRLAWFSVYFGMPHEVLHNVDDVSKFPEFLRKHGFIGTSDAMVNIFMAEISEADPEARIVFINRSYEDAALSADKNLPLMHEGGMDLNDIRDYMRYNSFNGLELASRLPNAIIVDYDDVDDQMEHINDWVGIEYVKPWHALLKGMRITRILSDQPHNADNVKRLIQEKYGEAA